LQDPIRTRCEDGILEVIIDRPKANSIDLATSRKMGLIFRDFRDNPDLRVAIVTGAGEKFFSAGWDLKAAAAGDAVAGDYAAGAFVWQQEARELTKPTIHALKRPSALPEIRSGTVAAAASIKLPKRTPYHIAMDMLLPGRWLNVEEAHRWGFVNEIVTADKLMDRAWELARLLTSGPPLVYAAIKEIVREAEGSTFQTAMNKITKRQFATVDVLYSSEDQLEGARAFAEKRPPIWKGR